MTGRAAGFLLADLTLLAVALSTGETVFYLLFLCLALVLFFALESALVALFTTRVTVYAPRKRVVRGETISLRVVVRRLSVMPIGAAELVISSPEGEESERSMPVLLTPLKEKEFRSALVCPHRGSFSVGATRLTVEDIFGLFSFSRAIRQGTARVEALPRCYETPSVELAAAESQSQARLMRMEDTSSPSGVRAWQDGDDLKRVHWKLTMRRHEMMVRTYDESARPDTLILMDVSAVQAIGGQKMTIEDAMCEAAAAMAKAQLEAGYPVRMPLASQNPVEIAGQHVNDALRFQEALMRLVFDGPYDFEQVLMLETRRMRRTGGLILITTHLNAALCDMAMRMRQNDMRVHFIWVNESTHKESMKLLKRMELGGLTVRQIDPWAQ